MLLFSLLVWGELAQVEFMDFKVVEWLVEVWANCPGGNMFADGEYSVSVCGGIRHLDHPLSGALWQLSQPKASAQPQGKNSFPTLHAQTHTYTQGISL